MIETVLVIILTFTQSSTEIYEYSMISQTECLKVLEVAKVSSNTSVFCTIKPK